MFKHQFNAKDANSEIENKYKAFEPVFSLKMSCARNSEHNLFFQFLVTDEQILKIGQYPSIEDIQAPLDPKIEKILTKEKYGEFKRACGLFAHGIGIGSFVYLRRIIEFLIESASTKAISENSIVEGDLKGLRWNEKIKKLKGYLPDFLVDSPEIYSILSKGIHELSEEECRKYFVIIRQAIEIILDEELSRRNKEMAKEKIKSELSKMQNK